MALIKCPECGREISDKAGSCPHCGYPIQDIPQVENDTASEAQEASVEKKDAVSPTSTTVSSEPKRKKGGAAIAIGIVAVIAIIIVVAVTAKKCYICGRTKNVRSVTLVGETYYLCDEHYKEIMTPSTKTTTTYYTSTPAPTPSTSSKFKTYLTDNKITLDNYDVQYDQQNNRNKLFSLQGTAELSDYYNYGYDDVEKTHFCLEVTPIGGTYTDRWYIYCHRESFQSVLDKAKEKGTIHVEMVCEITKWEKNQNRMAELEYIVY